MSDLKLGCLERTELRDIWPSEASDFTPWLSSEENLPILGEALGLHIAFEAREKAVGPFRADILCRNVETNELVLIENQLECTDHKHLGQILTYASGLQTATIVWIAAEFTDEHRAALDWLNQITADNFHFFGLEVELWHIGDSLAAPKFNVIAKPNAWSRSIAQAVRAIDDEDMSETRLLQRDYWLAFTQCLKRISGPYSEIAAQPPARGDMTFPIGRSFCTLAAGMQRKDHWIRTELYIRGDSKNTANAYFESLQKQRADIEKDFGEPLNWQALPGKRDCRISCELEGADPQDRTDWPRQHEWLAQHLNAMHNAFSKKVEALEF